MLSTAIYPALSASRPPSHARSRRESSVTDSASRASRSPTRSAASPLARQAGPAKTSLAAASAGTDLVLYTSLGDAAKAQRALARGLSNGSLDRAEFQASVSRILALRSGFSG